MEEITFSYFDRGKDVPNHLPALVDQFHQEQGIKVRLESIPWAMGWTRMVEVALYHSGPDVSEIGSTWAGDLTRMEALRPFRQDEIEAIRGSEHFFENVWDSAGKTMADPASVYSIPWSGDVRAVFYRRDWLENARIDEAQAFKNTDQFEQTLATLRSRRLPIPLVLPTQRTNLTIHNIASWIWGAGGSFLSPNHSTITFDQPEAIKGANAYYRLGRYLGEAAYAMEDFEAYQLFYSGKVAIALGGYWILHSTAMTDEVRKNLGIQPMPGVPFIGGNHLVLWNHTRHELAALKFIQFLQSEEAGKSIYPQFGLPVRQSAWAHPPFDQEQYRALLSAIKFARGFPTGQLWGLVEKRLTDILADIWVGILKNPDQDPGAVVEPQLKGLANRLRLTLGDNPV